MEIIMEERRVDLRIPNPERSKEGKRTTGILHRFNAADPLSVEYQELMKELFTGGFWEKSKVVAPFYANLAADIHIGKNVVIMPYCKCMSAGNIYIEDNVRIALNTSILTNNHDFYERDVLTVKDVRICKNAWNGAGVTILPGVTIGENAIVGAASVATKDVAPNTVVAGKFEDNCVIAGNPAKVIRELDGERFKEE